MKNDKDGSFTLKLIVGILSYTIVLAAIAGQFDDLGSFETGIDWQQLFTVLGGLFGCLLIGGIAGGVGASLYSFLILKPTEKLPNPWCGILRLIGIVVFTAASVLACLLWWQM